MTAHDHRTYVAGCFRCELSRDEAQPMTSPSEAIFYGFEADETLRGADNQRLPDAALWHITDIAMDALAAAGYQVVPDMLVEAATETAETRPAIWSDDEFMLRHAAATKRLAAALAQHRGADPTDVFTEGGA